MTTMQDTEQNPDDSTPKPPRSWQDALPAPVRSVIEFLVRISHVMHSFWLLNLFFVLLSVAMGISGVIILYTEPRGLNFSTIYGKIETGSDGPMLFLLKYILNILPIVLALISPTIYRAFGNEVRGTAGRGWRSWILHSGVGIIVFAALCGYSGWAADSEPNRIVGLVLLAGIGLALAYPFLCAVLVELAPQGVDQPRRWGAAGLCSAL